MTACSPSESSQCCGRPADRADRLTTFSSIVQDYRDHYDNDKTDQESWFGLECKSLGEAIARATASKLRHGNYNSHQRRINKSVFGSAERALLKIESQFAATATFDDVLRLVDTALKGISGAGELFRYDVADRIGCYLKLRPDQIYLHAGVRIGVENLGLGVSQTSISLSELNGRFENLSAPEIENLLCIYKDQMKLLRRQL